MKKRILIQKFCPPYSGTKTTYSIRKRPGVYIVKDKVDHEILYVGFSGSDVYKALYRHFESWHSKYQQRVTFNRNSVLVRVVYCNTAASAYKLEKALIIKLKPSQNIDKYWINYDMDEGEKKILDEYTKDMAAPFVISAKDIPF